MLSVLNYDVHSCMELLIIYHEIINFVEVGLPLPSYKQVFNYASEPKYQVPDLGSICILVYKIL